MNETTDKVIHQGRNVKRFREMMGWKQEGLATELGDDWNQQRVSLLEGRETIDPTVLEQVAKVLKVPAEAIMNFDEETAVNIISNTFNNNSHDQSTFHAFNVQPTFNPLDKMVELYERMLKEKDELIAELRKGSV